ncbi:MAG: hypothetical protein FWG10_08770 [Eubacteriaceae bacterium]|nr:hypothetical protein [Eubacteriaceae bacterium]
MRHAPTIKQWEKLFVLAAKIKALAPWNQLSEEDLVSVVFPHLQEPVYCSIMGGQDGCFGVAVFPGYAALDSFKTMSKNYDGVVPYNELYEGNCLLCNFGDKDEIAEADMEIYEQLGLKFKGSGNWVYFRALEPGYLPWSLDSHQADFMAGVLERVIDACASQGILGFSSDETLLCVFDGQQEVWESSVVDFKQPPVRVDLLMIDDDLMVENLNTLEQTDIEFEFESAIIPLPFVEEGYDRPILPRLLLLVDRKEEALARMSLAKPEEDLADPVIGMLEDYISKQARPKRIFSRNVHTARLIADLCNLLNIDLVIGDELLASQKIVANLIEEIAGSGT